MPAMALSPQGVGADDHQVHVVVDERRQHRAHLAGVVAVQRPPHARRASGPRSSGPGVAVGSAQGSSGVSGVMGRAACDIRHPGISVRTA